MTERHEVPTHLDTPDGIGSWTIRQGLLLVSTALFVAPAVAMSVPPVGPALGDLARLMPTLGGLVPPGLVPLAPVAAGAVPMVVAGALALPLNPPVEHGLISWARYRTQTRVLGPALIDELIGHPTVERDVATVFGKYVALWQMPSVSMRLASESARNVERARWAAFLDGVPCPIETSVRARPIDLEAVFEKMGESPNPNGALTASFLRASSAAGGEVQRQRLLAIRADSADQLHRYALDVDGALARATIRGERLEGDDLADALHQAWTHKPRKRRIGPGLISIESDGLRVDGEWVTTLAQQRWPTAVPMDFMAGTYDGTEPIDVHQIIRPQDTIKVRKKLEDLQFRLQTTKLTRQRKVALEQLDATLEALERNQERVFEVEVFYAVRAPDRQTLADRRRRVQTICGEMGGEAAPLRWEHADGALACAGVLESRLLKRSHRVDTSSISRAFPWGASELGLEGGVPWGRTLFGNRRVVWTPFARPLIANPQTAIYATSGGGKGFGVKVWTARALLAGVVREAFMLDQAEESRDGEYGRWARYCGGEVRRVEGALWEQDLACAVRDIPRGTLPPAIVLNIAGLNRPERCRAMVAFKRAVYERAMNAEANRSFGLDEMWSFQGDREAEGEIEDLVRRGRHGHIAGFYMTQRPMDALNSELGRTVQSVCATQWFGMQSPSEISDVSARLRWTPEQVQVIERFGAGEAMLVAGRDRLAFRVDFSPEEYAMAHTDHAGKESSDAVRSDHVFNLADHVAGGTDDSRADNGAARAALDAEAAGLLSGVA